MCACEYAGRPLACGRCTMPEWLIKKMEIVNGVQTRRDLDNNRDRK